jgi:hypothetical protein
MEHTIEDAAQELGEHILQFVREFRDEDIDPAFMQALTAVYGFIRLVTDVWA